MYIEYNGYTSYIVKKTTIYREEWNADWTLRGFALTILQKTKKRKFDEKNTFKLPLFLVELMIAYLFFSKSRISESNFSSAVGSGLGAGAAGSSFFFCDNLLMAFTSKNTQKAIMIKLKTFCKKFP